jgi:hypothetical protein
VVVREDPKIRDKRTSPVAIQAMVVKKKEVALVKVKE